jgi:cysteinyl-tRNA synthetase
MHNGMLQLQGEKMSKSLGNLVTINDFLSRHEPDSLRMMVLGGSYRAPLSYSDEIVEAAERGLDRLRSALKAAPASASGASGETRAVLDQQIHSSQQAFVDAMDDDFNTSGGLAALFELVRIINTSRDSGATSVELGPAQETLRTLAGVLGLRLEEKKSKGGKVDDAHINELVARRTEARQKKDWSTSDNIRETLEDLGIKLEDSKDGTTWHW